jgi:predicted transcriptional regulator
MARPASNHPTDLELEILKVLWRDGPHPVRHVRDALAAATPPRDLAYTSVMTVMNIMADKGYLRRAKDSDTGGGSFIYHPTISQRSTTGRMLKDLVDRAFNGSAAAAALNLLKASDVNDAELKQLRELIREKSKQRREER